jgi:hypothetical protein
VVDEGVQIGVSTNGVDFQEIPEEAAANIRFEVACLTNDVRRYSINTRLHAEMLLKGAGGHSSRWLIEEDGLCRAILMGTPPLGQSLIPISVSRLSNNHRFYSAWRRNAEQVIYISRIDTRAQLYRGEFSMQTLTSST